MKNINRENTNVVINPVLSQNPILPSPITFLLFSIIRRNRISMGIVRGLKAWEAIIMTIGLPPNAGIKSPDKITRTTKTRNKKCHAKVR